MLEKEAENRIKQLINEIEYHDNLYYIKGTSEILDEDYDKIFRELENLENKFPNLKDILSPTQRVGGKPLEGFNQQKHKLPMLSVNDIFSKEEFESFFKRIQKNTHLDSIPMIIEPKVDGVAVSLHYENGKLISALSRGDGITGDNIIQNIKTIATIPLKIKGSTPEFIEIRGEVFMTNDGFESLNSNREIKGEKIFKNPRNATAGTLKLLDSKEASSRPLNFIAHGFGLIQGANFKEMKEFHSFLVDKSISMLDPIFYASKLSEIYDCIQEINLQRNKLNYQIDGAVVKVNDIDIQKKIGYTARAPKWAVAFKYSSEKKETVIRNIIIQVGRTGVLTPVAELDPVQISGSTVSRVTLHNQSEIDRKDIRVGDSIIVEKAGEIIPSVVDVLYDKRPKESKKFHIKDEVNGICPSCNTPIHKPDTYVAWMCINPDCSAKLANQIKQFVSRKALNIDGIGTIVAEKLVEREMVGTLMDIFFLKEENLASMNIGIGSKPRLLGDKVASKIITSLNRALEYPLHRWILSLGISNTGESASRELSRLHPNFKSLMNSEILLELKTLKIGQRKEDNPKISQYSISNELGAVVAGKVLDFFDTKKGIETVSKMDQLNINPKSENYYLSDNLNKQNSSTIEGKVFVITGTLDHKRDDIKDKIISSGAKVSSSVSNNTDFLICGKNPGSKQDKAQNLNIKIISEKDFFDMV